ncbi:restriction endonuclease subunit S [Psittacicella gerlachiana]|uniref:Type I restriction modification DNA specificity domain-containing protein n=1 Tax=Psittacicella gerlachiana TaxID=2028574 RepID=A0A3A1Y868_9GAMM|nr:restriction endonuclease subunit S [Psittacicella gerlachiana]RIY33845.1 hypothetical protein CKF59_06070 [Psittacicella gerlachiana]
MPQAHSSWQSTTLGTLGESFSVTTGFSRKDLTPTPSPYPCLHYMQIGRDYFSPVLKQAVSYLTQVNPELKLAPYQALLFPTIGSDPSKPVTRILLNLSQEPLYLGRDIFVFTLKDNSPVLAEYINWLLYAQPQRLTQVQQSNEIQIKHLKRKEIEQIPIDYPDLDTQSKIISICEQMMQTLLHYQELISLYQQQLQALEEEIFPLQEQDHPTWSWQPLKALSQSISLSPRLPEDLKVQAIQDQEHPFPYYNRSRELNYCNRALSAGVAILITGDGSKSEHFHYLNEQQIFTAFPRVYCLRNFSHQIIPKFFFYALRYYLKRNRQNNSSTQFISLKDLQATNLAFPDLAKQKEIVQLFEQLEQLQSLNQVLFEQAQQKFSLLQQELFSPSTFTGKA